AFFSCAFPLCRYPYKEVSPCGGNPPIYTVLNAAFSAPPPPPGAPWWRPPLPTVPATPPGSRATSRSNAHAFRSPSAFHMGQDVSSNIYSIISLIIIKNNLCGCNLLIKPRFIRVDSTPGTLGLGVQ